MIDLFSLIRKEGKHLEGKNEEEILSHILKTIEREVIHRIAPETRGKPLPNQEPERIRLRTRPPVLRRHTPQKPA